MSWYLDQPFWPDLQTFDPPLQDSGILDKDGNKIYKAPRPVGFGRDHECRNKYLLLKS